MYPRLCNIIKSHSFFLFGARATGKSHLLRGQFGSNALLWIDLLRDKDFLEYSRDPELLYRQATALAKKSTETHCWIIVDEVQRVPQLLNEAHRVLEDPLSHGKILFGLTGSSARKLKRGAANLLGGRALVNYLFPLTSFELGEHFNLSTTLNWGTLPMLANESSELVKAELLESYLATYLREEIREEQVVRQLDPFTRFLEVAAQTSGQIVNYASVGRDCKVDAKAVARYYQILEDTLIGVFVPAYDRSVRQQQSQSPRFYIFDMGVKRALSGQLNIPLTPHSYGYGNAFEQFVILEIFRLNSYLRKRYKLFYLRTKDGAEIDLIIERPGLSTLLIEIKSSSSTTREHCKHLEALLGDFKDAEALLLSQDLKERAERQVDFMHWQAGLKRIFDL